MRNYRAIYLSRNYLNCQYSITSNNHLINGGGFPAGGEYFRSHVVARFGEGQDVVLGGIQAGGGLRQPKSGPIATALYSL